jgi:RNA polymerase sigma factor (sigma-70 family)
VCYPAFVSLSASLFISEDPAPHQFGQNSSGWTDDEITAIRRVLQKLTAIRILNDTDAEDLVQETLLTMIAKNPGPVLQKGPLIWSMGILRNKVGNYYRKAQRYASLEQWETHARRRNERSMLAGSPEVAVLRKELQQIVNDTMAQLPVSQRRPIELLLAGLNAGEIVRELYPERYQNVINRLHRGRKKMAQELAKHGFGPPNVRAGMHQLKRCRMKKKSEKKLHSGSGD